MKTIEERVGIIERDNEAQDNQIKQIFDDIRDIKETLLRRPSWAVTVIITILSTICAGLIVGILI
jgi:tetrahydromethanopterin S-methyltransferase subunit F